MHDTACTPANCEREHAQEFGYSLQEPPTYAVTTVDASGREHTWALDMSGVVNLLSDLDTLGHTLISVKNPDR